MANNRLNSDICSKDKSPPDDQRILDFLIVAFKCCKIKQAQVNALQERFSNNCIHKEYRDSYNNSILHYIIASPLTESAKIHFIQSYFPNTDLVLPNGDGVTFLDIAVIRNEPSLLAYTLSASDSTVTDENLMRACKMLLFFDHFTQHYVYGALYEILSLYISKYRSIFKPIEKKLLTLSSDADGLETAFNLLLDSKRCTEVACSLGALKFLKTANKKDFYHSCILTVSNRMIPTINESMLEHVPGCLCVRVAEVMTDAYLTGRGPLSPVRYKLSFYCDWYLSTLYRLLHDDLFNLAELPALNSLFQFVNTLSLWYGYYPKSKSLDIYHVRLSLQNFLEKAGSLSVAVGSTNIPFKRFFTLINIFCLIKHCIHRNIDPVMDLEFIQFLVECGFSLNERDAFGCYPLHILTATQPHQYYQSQSITRVIEYLVRKGAYPLSFDCYCRGNAFEFANRTNREILGSCYPKPYSLKSLTALLLVGKYPEAVTELNIPQGIAQFVLSHSDKLPFLPMRGFYSNRIVVECNDKLENIYISMN